MFNFQYSKLLAKKLNFEYSKFWAKILNIHNSKFWPKILDFQYSTLWAKILNFQYLKLWAKIRKAHQRDQFIGNSVKILKLETSMQAQNFENFKQLADFYKTLYYQLLNDACNVLAKIRKTSLIRIFVRNSYSSISKSF